MTAYRTWLLLLMAAAHMAIATGTPYIATVVDTNEDIHTLKNYNGWINPEDLAPMPQCIAQQDHSTWLAAVTACTTKRCTSHFGVICTHHQWLTQLSCLNTKISPDLLKAYLPYCGRSVLSKAQLYQWVLNVTSRTWLVGVGDANELQNLSPASLVDGYADLDVVHYAPTCLTESVTAQPGEAYQHVMASCMFTDSARVIGNAARPWEYRESLHSMVALSYRTVGYDITGHGIQEGNYFDRKCFCSFFAVDPENEPCAESGQLDLTRERLWINATCGTSSLPMHWTDTIQTTELGYVPLEDWYWPLCVGDMPQQVTSLPDHCVVEACELNSGGYCSDIKPAVDRACFCHNVSYDSCGGLCHVFETRIDYIKWLRDMCGDVENWHGLPDDWRRLAAPTSREMIPWRWSVKPSATKGDCPSIGWKLGSLALVNCATLPAVMLSQRDGIRRIAYRWRPESWYFRGILIAAYHLFANSKRAFQVQKVAGYEDVPANQLLLLWSTMPRLLSWFSILFIGAQPFDAMNLSAVGACLVAEVILQSFSSYYMLKTVQYGIEHNFYFGGGLGNAEKAWVAAMLYHGALIWLIVIGMALAGLVWAIHRINRMTRVPNLDPRARKPQQDRKGLSSFVEEWIAHANERYTRFRAKVIHFCMVECMDPEEWPLIGSMSTGASAYGTFSERGRTHGASRETPVGLYAALTLGLFLLWLAQWLFWSGIVVLSSDEYCPPEYGITTTVWIIFSMAGAVLGAP